MSLFYLKKNISVLKRRNLIFVLVFLISNLFNPCSVTNLKVNSKKIIYNLSKILDTEKNNNKSEEKFKITLNGNIFDKFSNQTNNSTSFNKLKEVYQNKKNILLYTSQKDPHPLSFIHSSKTLNKYKSLALISISKNLPTKLVNLTTFQSLIFHHDKYSYANTTEKCSIYNCPSPNLCIEDFLCKCSNNKANFPRYNITYNSNLPKNYCSYTRKKQIVAFLLEFFLLSIGHFYSGNYLIGILKVIFLLSILSFYYSSTDKNIIFTNIFVCFLSVWWLADSILYGINSYLDQNGVGLEML